MGTNSAPLLADLFLYSYGAEFVRRLVREGSRSLAVAFGSTFGCVDDVLSINSCCFRAYIGSMCPGGLGVGDATESS